MIDTVVNLNGQIDTAVTGKPKIERTMGNVRKLKLSSNVCQFWDEMLIIH